MSFVTNNDARPQVVPDVAFIFLYCSWCELALSTVSLFPPECDQHVIFTCNYTIICLRHLRACCVLVWIVAEAIPHIMPSDNAVQLGSCTAPAGL